MSSRLHLSACAALALAAVAVLPVRAFAQMDDADDPQRIERLESQIRQLTGRNEELQHRNRVLEDQIRQFQAGQPAAGAGRAAAPGPVATNPPSEPAYQQPGPAPVYQQQSSAQAAAPVVADQPAAAGRRRGDAFDPALNPNAPGAPRALGGGPAVGAPGGRGAGEPLDLANTAAPSSGGGLTTLPPAATPRDEFDLGIGYVQRKDYALAEETMRNFMQKYPSDHLVADAQYWLGESLFQRQRYRDAAEAFLGVTTKFETSVKAPDALLRLGQSLAALKEKEAACAALGEVARKYPKASAGVRQGVDREQKRIKC